MNILGVSCWYHDSAAALLKEGKVIAACEEEKFSREKHDFEFPINAVNFCLKKGGLIKDDLDCVVFYDKPIVKFERILSSILYSVPHSLGVFREAVPLWLDRKLRFRAEVKKLLGLRPENIYFCFHHLSHAASSFYLSPFKESAILTVDGVGEWATATLGEGRGNSIKLLKEMRFPNSLGLLYSVFTAFLGFKVNNGEYKVMGMAAYGRPRFSDKIYKMVEISADGSIRLKMDYFSFPHSVSKMYSRKFIELFGKPRKPESLFFTKTIGFPAFLGEKPVDFEEQARKNQYYADIAASIQKVLEDSLIKMARYLKKETGLGNLCYAGGVALNSQANYSLLKEKIFDNIYIQPAATDAGGALGAALWLRCQILGKKRPDTMGNIYLGESFKESEIIEALRAQNIPYDRVEDSRLFNLVAGELSKGKIIGWYQGRTEWGPRALGNRSILADPRNPDMKDIINSKIKFREFFRPFAPAILSDDVNKYIEKEREMYLDLFMLVAYPVKEEQKSSIPAVTHINGTARVQRVEKELNWRFWQLIKRFKELTGVGALLNTSFNLKGEPIVNSPANAVKTFLNSKIDILVMENFICRPSAQ